MFFFLQLFDTSWTLYDILLVKRYCSYPVLVMMLMVSEEDGRGCKYSFYFFFSLVYRRPGKSYRNEILRKNLCSFRVNSAPKSGNNKAKKSNNI